MANYVLLQKLEITNAVNTVTFSNIPQTGYTDLKIVASTRNSASNYGGFYLRFNSSTTGYTQKRLKQEGSSLTSDSSLEIPLTQSTWGAAYGSAEIYISNYTSSLYKSVLIDGVTENNAVENRNTLGSFLWSNTAAITTIALGTFDNGFSDSFIQNSTFSIYGIAATGSTAEIAPKARGGNTVMTDGTYWYHAFLSSGTFTPLVSLSAGVLVVAGGGAGASVGGSAETGGGGGAGGFRALSSQSFSTTPYAVVIGAGGSVGSNGSNSSVNSITASGGGGGGGGAGGSGGGGLSAGNSQRFGGAGNAGSYSPVEGYAGGNGDSSSGSWAGGGGGAGAAGSNGSSGQSGAGGIGSYNAISGGALTGVGILSSGNYYFAGGGGGGSASGVSSGAGGTGGGGGGNTAGTANTGGGGGGAPSSGGSSTAGGSGVVVIRYAV